MEKAMTPWPWLLEGVELPSMRDKQAYYWVWVLTVPSCAEGAINSAKANLPWKEDYTVTAHPWQGSSKTLENTGKQKELTSPSHEEKKMVAFQARDSEMKIISHYLRGLGCPTES